MGLAMKHVSPHIFGQVFFVRLVPLTFYIITIEPCLNLFDITTRVHEHSGNDSIEVCLTSATGSPHEDFPNSLSLSISLHLTVAHLALSALALLPI
jgi:hypothetical protein